MKLKNNSKVGIYMPGDDSDDDVIIPQYTDEELAKNTLENIYKQLVMACNQAALGEHRMLDRKVLSIVSTSYGAEPSVSKIPSASQTAASATASAAVAAAEAAAAATIASLSNHDTTPKKPTGGSYSSFQAKTQQVTYDPNQSISFQGIAHQVDVTVSSSSLSVVSEECKGAGAQIAMKVLQTDTNEDVLATRRLLLTLEARSKQLEDELFRCEDSITKFKLQQQIEKLQIDITEIRKDVDASKLKNRKR